MRVRAVLLALMTGGWLAAGDARAASYDLQWTAVWDSPTHGNEAAEDVALDGSGNSYVVGWTDRTDIGEGLNILVLKYSFSGALLWTRTHNGIPGGMDAAFGVAVDLSGNCFVAGSVSLTGGEAAGWLRMYDTAGNVMWTMTGTSPDPGHQAVFRDVAVAPGGGTVYVAGCLERGAPIQAGNGLLLKVWSTTFSGTPIWSVDADGGYGFWDEFLGVAVAPNGDPLVAGYQTLTDVYSLLDGAIMGRLDTMLGRLITVVDTDIVAARYTPAGAPVWRRSWGSQNNASAFTMDAGYGIAASAAGAVFVSGTAASSNAPPVNYDRWVRAWTGDGNAVTWTRLIDLGQDDRTDAGFRCATGPDGRLFVAGFTARPDVYRPQNLTLEQIDPSSGFIIHSDSYSSGYFLYDQGRGVAVDQSGSYVVAGFETRTDLSQGMNVLVRKYSGPVSPAQAAGVEVVYPNPFDPGRAVGGTLKFANLPANASVRIWSAAGLLVARVPVAGQGAAWDGRTGDGRPAAPGIYHYTIEAPGTPRVTGMIMLQRQ